MNGLKTTPRGLALALLFLAGAAPAGAATTAKTHHHAVAHHAAKSHVAKAHAAKAHGVKSGVHHRAATGRARHHGKTALAHAKPAHRQTELCRTVMVRHHEVEKCR